MTRSGNKVRQPRKKNNNKKRETILCQSLVDIRWVGIDTKLCVYITFGCTKQGFCSDDNCMWIEYMSEKSIWCPLQFLHIVLWQCVMQISLTWTVPSQCAHCGSFTSMGVVLFIKLYNKTFQLFSKTSPMKAVYVKQFSRPEYKHEVRGGGSEWSMILTNIQHTMFMGSFPSTFVKTSKCEDTHFYFLDQWILERNAVKMLQFLLRNRIWC